MPRRKVKIRSTSPAETPAARLQKIKNTPRIMRLSTFLERTPPDEMIEVIHGYPEALRSVLEAVELPRETFVLTVTIAYGQTEQLVMRDELINATWEAGDWLWLKRRASLKTLIESCGDPHDFDGDVARFQSAARWRSRYLSRLGEPRPVLDHGCTASEAAPWYQPYPRWVGRFEATDAYGWPL